MQCDKSSFELQIEMHLRILYPTTINKELINTRIYITTDKSFKFGLSNNVYDITETKIKLPSFKRKEQN